MSSDSPNAMSLNGNGPGRAAAQGPAGNQGMPEASNSKQDQAVPAFALLGRFFRDFMRPHRKAWACVAALVVFNVLLQLPLPLFTMYMIDHAVTPKNPGLLTVLGVVLIAFVIARHVSNYLTETLTLRLKEDIILVIQLTLIRHMQRLPLTFFSDKHSGYLQSRVMNDARGVEGALVRNFVTLFVEGFSFLAVMTLILFMRLDLGLLLLVFLVPFAYIRYYANERMRILSKQMQETQALASTIVYEGFAGIRTIKAYQREDFYAGIIKSWLDRLRKTYIDTNWFGILSSVGASFFTSLCLAVVLWYGCNLVIKGEATLGRIIGVYSYLGFLYGPINTFVATNLRIHQSAAAIQRIYEFLTAPQESGGGAQLQGIRGKIEFRNVSFAYSDDQDVLRDVSFTIWPGSVVAIVGHTGAGKSTLVNLLLRFYESHRGQILLDDVDVQQIAIGSLRSIMGIVDQQALMFNGTVLENIRFGNPESSFDEIVHASKLSYAHEFIERLLNGYDTFVGERGLRLSAGQCQRIALARVFLRDPQILILDEAVSSIDSESERYIHQALVPLLGRRTTVVIAHRLSSLMLADHVIVLEHGRVVEQGSHRQLLEANGPYTRLFHEQFELQDKVEARAEGAVHV